MNLKIKGGGKSNGLLKLLAWIEFCGDIGHTPKYLKTYIDGDGITRYKFEFEDEETQTKYKMIIKDMLKNGIKIEKI